jgi:class 3 adenylate cyclase
VLRTAIESHDGFLFSHTGDGVVAAFASPMSAVDAAVAAQREPATVSPPIKTSVSRVTSTAILTFTSSAEECESYCR